MSVSVYGAEGRGFFTMLSFNSIHHLVPLLLKAMLQQLKSKNFFLDFQYEHFLEN